MNVDVVLRTVFAGEGDDEDGDEGHSDDEDDQVENGNTRMAKRTMIREG